MELVARRQEIMQQINPKDLHKRLTGSEDSPFLLDVRTPEEWDICRIEGSHLIPMQEITSRLDEIPEDQDVVVICHHGVRSANVLMALVQQFDYESDRLFNLRGGVDLYSVEADPDLPRY